MDEGLRLTDDELVSMALDVDAPVPVILPTVDVQDEQAVVAAGVRGQRSLFVRGLVDPEHVDPRISRIQRAMSSPVRFTSFAGNRSLDRAVLLPATTWMPDRDGWLRVQEGAMGTYLVVEGTLESAKEELKELFDVARLAPPEPAEPGVPELWICLAVVTAEGVRGLAARQGQVVSTFIPGGQQAVVEERDSDESGSLIDAVMAGLPDGINPS